MINRLHALDALRGLTIAGMIMVNNAGNWGSVFAPLRHAAWNGLTPADLVFPFFMFIMGVSAYISLSRCNFKPRWGYVVRRFAVIFGLGLGLATIKSGGSFEHLRLPGVLQRLAIGWLVTVIAAVWARRAMPWIVAGILAAWFATLHTAGEGVAGFVDTALMGAKHLLRPDFDPEGTLTTLPAACNVMIGFLIGKWIVSRSWERFFSAGAIMILAGWLLSWGCPINKVLWSPTFVMVTCGAGASLLALLGWWEDSRAGLRGGRLRFFEIFGANPLVIYIFSEIMGTVLAAHHGWFATGYWPSLCWSLLFVGASWLLAWGLQKGKIIIKI